MPTCEPMPASLAACRDAEDYFRLLDVPFDERVLGPGRLHILRLFGRELDALGLSLGDSAAPDLPRYRAALTRAYAALLDGGPLQHRVFKVLQDRAPGQFVPDADIAVDGPNPPLHPLPAPIDPLPAPIDQVSVGSDPDGGESR